jgi:NDP-sugar pyrophosphorylase family protein
VRHLSVTVNYLKEQIEDHFKEPKDGIKIQTVREPKFLGTIGSIKYVEEFYNDTILLMNSDLFTNIDYEDFFLHFKEYDADMSIAAVPYTISVPYGIFELEGRNVKGVLEKPTYNYYANAGIYLIKRNLLNLIPKDTFFNATDFMELLLDQGYKVVRFPLNSTWIDIGNPQEYQKAKDLVKHIK